MWEYVQNTNFTNFLEFHFGARHSVILFRPIMAVFSICSPCLCQISVQAPPWMPKTDAVGRWKFRWISLMVRLVSSKFTLPKKSSNESNGGVLCPVRREVVFDSESRKFEKKHCKDFVEEIVVAMGCFSRNSWLRILLNQSLDVKNAFPLLKFSCKGFVPH